MTILDSIEGSFREAFPEAGAPCICRAPGRINLIGEHLDYNGLPVLPMAIDRAAYIAFSPRRDARIRLRNQDAAFPPVEFENAATIPASKVGSWENYFKAAVQGLNKHLEPGCRAGMDAFVWGDVPAAAGLSSSSAMVVASALAYLSVLEESLGEAISRLELASLLAESEQYVGTRGGGMDQAIILCGKADCASRIGFFPLRVEEVPLLSDHVVVACNSLVKAEKTGEALHRYNEGPLTCRLICAMVEAEARRQFGAEIILERLADLWYGPLCLTDSEVESLFLATFPEESTSLEEAGKRLGLSVSDIRARWLDDLKEPADGFRLKARARHQLSEFGRVEQARDLLLADDAVGMGELMNESHRSCAEDYAVSCPELDRLVETALDCGAIGARMTGAGFGGCTVNLVPTSEVGRFIEGVRAGYYEPQCAGVAPPADAILVAKASAGAGYCSGCGEE